jgi:hypothetical protein
MKISLKTPFFYNGHRYNPGDVVDLPAGTDGPYDSNGPAFDVIDEESWNERRDLAAKHAREIAELETPERKRLDLVRRQSEESAELRRKHADKELTLKHERERADLETQHKGQVEALKNREPEHVVAPRETNEAQLGERHKVESEELKARQEAERKALAEEHEEAQERKAQADKRPEPPAPRPREPVPPPVFADEHKAVSQGQMAD